MKHSATQNSMRSKTKNRFAGVTGLLVGLLSLISGSAVLLGLTQPDYTVLRWLVIYNTSMGVVSIAAGVGIWSAQMWAARIASYITTAHVVVLLVLFVMYASTYTVALQSMGAMTFRSFIWIGITLTVWKKK